MSNDPPAGPGPAGGSDSAAAFGEEVRHHLARIERENADVLDAVAGTMLDVVRGDGLVYAAGTGHSMALVLETFYRAGGLACVYPIYHAGLLPLEGGSASTLVERQPRLAATLLARVSPGDGDLAFVFSNSGVNAVPVELAMGFREAGTPVVAVVSVPHMSATPARADAKLGDVAAQVIDTLVPPGDAAFHAGGVTTAALSSIASVFVWDLLLARVAEAAAEKGVDLPVWTSANVPGGDERNEALMERYRRRVPLL
jgi:uncharacterized phosphosugar-binding protein